MFKKFRFAGLAVVFMLSMMLAACGSSGDDENEGGSSSDSDDSSGDNGVELGDKDLSIPYVAWAGAEARTFVVAAVLEDAGYNVDPKQVEAGPMWSSVADDASSLTVCAWLPTTHEDYWKKYKDDVTNVNEGVIDKAPLALTVPKYMKDVNSIEDLKGNSDVGDATDWTITGIDPGAGIMHSTEKAIDNYDLGKWDLQESSEAAMLSELQKKMKDEKPIVVTLWKPHWAFADMDLKMLKDPDEVYGGDGDHIDIVANKELKDKSPGAYKILEQFTSDYDQLNELMGKIHDGEDPEKVADQFVKDNQDLVKKWEDGVATE